MKDGLGLDRRILEVLICPYTHSTLKYDKNKQELVNSTENIAYPIRDGIPLMLKDTARKLPED